MPGPELRWPQTAKERLRLVLLVAGVAVAVVVLLRLGDALGGRDAAPPVPTAAMKDRPATAISTPTPAAAPVTVQGRGTSAESVSLPEGTYRVRARWSNSTKNFEIWFKDSSAFECQLLVNNHTDESGDETHFCDHPGGRLRIQVEAGSGAEWSIRFERD